MFCNADGTPFEGQNPYTSSGRTPRWSTEATIARREPSPNGTSRSERRLDPRSARAGRQTADGRGNAERLVARHGRVLRYCQASKKWLVYDGRRWRMDAVAEVWRLAKDTVRQIYAEASQAETEEERSRSPSGPRGRSPSRA